jgi:hypothetical protein
MDIESFIVSFYNFIIILYFNWYKKFKLLSYYDKFLWITKMQ